MITTVVAQYRFNRLPENVEALRSIQQLTLTEGRLVTVDLMLSKGKKPWRLFGKRWNLPTIWRQCHNRKGRELGIINDGGNVYLTGINHGMY